MTHVSAAQKSRIGTKPPPKRPKLLPVLVHTSLPPQVDGQCRCFVKLTIRNVAFIDGFIPEGQKSTAVVNVLVKWWGEQTDGSIFQPKSGSQKAGHITAKYPVRCGPKQFAAYLNDMENLPLDVFLNDVLVGQAVVTNITQLNSSLSIATELQIFAVTNEIEIGTCSVSLAIVPLADAYDSSSSVPTTDFPYGESNQSSGSEQSGHKAKKIVPALDIQKAKLYERQSRSRSRSSSQERQDTTQNTQSKRMKTSPKPPIGRRQTSPRVAKPVTKPVSPPKHQPLVEKAAADSLNLLEGLLKKAEELRTKLNDVDQSNTIPHRTNTEPRIVDHAPLLDRDPLYPFDEAIAHPSPFHDEDFFYNSEDEREEVERMKAAVFVDNEVRVGEPALDLDVDELVSDSMLSDEDQPLEQHKKPAKRHQGFPAVRSPSQGTGASVRSVQVDNEMGMATKRLVAVLDHLSVELRLAEYEPSPLFSFKNQDNQRRFKPNLASDRLTVYIRFTLALLQAFQPDENISVLDQWEWNIDLPLYQQTATAFELFDRRQRSRLTDEVKARLSSLLLNEIASLNKTTGIPTSKFTLTVEFSVSNPDGGRRVWSSRDVDLVDVLRLPCVCDDVVVSCMPAPPAKGDSVPPLRMHLHLAFGSTELPPDRLQKYIRDRARSTGALMSDEEDDVQKRKHDTTVTPVVINDAANHHPPAVDFSFFICVDQCFMPQRLAADLGVRELQLVVRLPPSLDSANNILSSDRAVFANGRGVPSTRSPSAVGNADSIAPPVLVSFEKTLRYSSKCCPSMFRQGSIFGVVELWAYCDRTAGKEPPIWRLVGIAKLSTSAIAEDQHITEGDPNPIVLVDNFLAVDFPAEVLAAYYKEANTRAPFVDGTPLTLTQDVPGGDSTRRTSGSVTVAHLNAIVAIGTERQLSDDRTVGMRGFKVRRSGGNDATKSNQQREYGHFRVTISRVKELDLRQYKQVLDRHGRATLQTWFEFDCGQLMEHVSDDATIVISATTKWTSPATLNYRFGSGATPKDRQVALNHSDDVWLSRKLCFPQAGDDDRTTLLLKFFVVAECYDPETDRVVTRALLADGEPTDGTPQLAPIGYVKVDLTPIGLGLERVSGWYHIVDVLGECVGYAQLSIEPLFLPNDVDDADDTDIPRSRNRRRRQSRSPVAPRSPSPVVVENHVLRSSLTYVVQQTGTDRLSPVQISEHLPYSVDDALQDCAQPGNVAEDCNDSDTNSPSEADASTVQETLDVGDVMISDLVKVVGSVNAFETEPEHIADEEEEKTPVPSLFDVAIKDDPFYESLFGHNAPATTQVEEKMTEVNAEEEQQANRSESPNKAPNATLDATVQTSSPSVSTSQSSQRSELQDETQVDGVPNSANDAQQRLSLTERNDNDQQDVESIDSSRSSGQRTITLVANNNEQVTNDAMENKSDIDTQDHGDGINNNNCSAGDARRNDDKTNMLSLVEMFHASKSATMTATTDFHDTTKSWSEDELASHRRTEDGKGVDDTHDCEIDDASFAEDSVPPLPASIEAPMPEWSNYVSLCEPHPGKSVTTSESAATLTSTSTTLPTHDPPATSSPVRPIKEDRGSSPIKFSEKNSSDSIETNKPSQEVRTVLCLSPEPQGDVNHSPSPSVSNSDSISGKRKSAASNSKFPDEMEIKSLLKRVSHLTVQRPEIPTQSTSPSNQGHANTMSKKQLKRLEEIFQQSK